MPFFLFVAVAPIAGLSGSSRRPATCSKRRCRGPTSCASSPSSADDQWLELARDLSSNPNEKDPPRQKPVWEYPDGNNFSTPEYVPDDEDRLENPWSTWNSALESERVAAEKGVHFRDPSAETDFWRQSARDITGVNHGTNAVISARADDTAAERTVPQDRGSSGPTAPIQDGKVLPVDVTGAVADLQTQLWDELESSDSKESNMSYRDIARQILDENDVYEEQQSIPNNPPNSSLDFMEHRNQPLAPESSVLYENDADSASSGSGWNPDVDWKRFDDVKRESKLAQDKADRESAMRMAQQMSSEAQSYQELAPNSARSEDVSAITYTDVDGRELSRAEVEAAIAEGAVFVDEDGNDLPFSVYEAGTSRSLRSPESAPSIGDRSFTKPRAGAYGGTAGLDVSRNSPSASITSSSNPESWLDVAREVGAVLTESELLPATDQSSLASSPHSGQESSSSLKFDSPIAHGSGDDSSPNRTSDVIEVGEQTALDPDTIVDSGEISDAWSLWNSGRKAWEIDVESAKPRDAKQEVDIWRSTVRSIIPDMPASSARADRGRDVEAFGAFSSDEGGNIDEWRSYARSIAPNEPTDTAAVINGDLDFSQESTTADVIESSPESTSEETNAWSSWNSANSSWEQSVGRSDSSKISTSSWLDVARELSSSTGAGDRQQSADGVKGPTLDWGAPLPVSSKQGDSPWSYWLDDGSGGARSSWWETRLDVAKNRKPVTAASDSDVAANMNIWRSAAKDVIVPEDDTQQSLHPQNEQNHGETQIDA